MVNGEHQQEVNVKPSQAAIGRALGLSPAAVSKAKSKGMPVDSIEAAKAWRSAHVNLVAPKRDLPPTRRDQVEEEPLLLEEGFQAARTRREIAEANLAELKEAEQNGQLLRADAVRAAWAKRLISTRDALLQIPSRLAPVLAAESNLDTVALLLEEEIRQALFELSRGGETS